VTRTTAQSSSVASIADNWLRRDDARLTMRTDKYIQLYYRQYKPRIKVRSHISYEGPIVPPKWYKDVETRINKSTSSGAGQSVASPDFVTIEPEVAKAANTFFKHCGSFLPSEPYIYPSNQGDLIAEFADERGPLTIIISPRSVIIFAVADGVANEMKFAISSNLDSVWRKLSERSGAVHHGSMETAG
jgi:hypothetical protein